ncbi:syndecan-4 isoform X2 [Cyclopterus lumpus]|uniref:syndecan-4 isoform X2 n=1 Tax=Cyclopterus lumpus TaxID=8103 RepID=UPI001486B0B5|nr:syndecan-4 isoform X2 [Cyclopterus lumpus]
MLNICLVLVLSASVLSESVRETETWMPMRTTQTAAMSTRHDHPESSGDSPNGSDFGFTDAEDAKNDYDAEDDDDDEEEEDTDYYPTRCRRRGRVLRVRPRSNDRVAGSRRRAARRARSQRQQDPGASGADRRGGPGPEPQRDPPAEEGGACGGAPVQRPHVPRQRGQHLQQDGGPGSSDRGAAPSA